MNPPAEASPLNDVQGQCLLKIDLNSVLAAAQMPRREPRQTTDTVCDRKCRHDTTDMYHCLLLPQPEAETALT